MTPAESTRAALLRFTRALLQMDAAPSLFARDPRIAAAMRASLVSEIAVLRMELDAFTTQTTAIGIKCGIDAEGAWYEDVRT